MNGELIFSRNIVSLSLCKEYLTAVKFDINSLTADKILNVSMYGSFRFDDCNSVRESTGKWP